MWACANGRAETEARIFTGAGPERGRDQRNEYRAESKGRRNDQGRRCHFNLPVLRRGLHFTMHVKDDFIFKVTTPFDLPVNHGNLCVKGRFGYDYIYHPKRVTTPLIRKTKQEAANARRPLTRPRVA